jgi:hypothetical protein
MKITTQRTLIWVLNFALVGVILVVLGLRIQNQPVRQSPERKKQLKTLDAEVTKALQKHRNKAAGDETLGRERLTSVAANTFSGHIEQIKPVATAQKTEDAGAAPDLATLIEVMVTLAPQHTSGGPHVEETASAMIKIKSKADLGALFYREGETIGINNDPLSGNRPRDDEDPKLKQFGGAKIVRIERDGIVCEWAKKEVAVKLPSVDEITGMVVTNSSKQVVYGSRSAAGGGPAGAGVAAEAQDLGTFTAGTDANPNDTFNISEAGMKTLTDRGDQLIEQISFETTEVGSGDEGDKTAGQGIRIRSLPRELSDRGLRDGDVIVRIDMTAVSSKESIVNYVRQTYRQKQQYTVTVLRDGAQRILTVNVPRTFRELRDARKKFVN